MAKIGVNVIVRVHDGKLDALKDIANRCLTSVQEKDTGTLQYDWYISDDGKTCMIRETYADSDAVLSHVGNLGPLLGQLSEVGSLELTILGEPTDQLREATAPMGAVIYETIATL